MVTLPFVQTANKPHQSAGHPEEGHRQLMAEHSYMCITSKTWQYFFVFAQAPDCKLRQDTMYASARSTGSRAWNREPLCAAHDADMRMATQCCINM